MAALKYAALISTIVFVLFSAYQAFPTGVQERKRGKKLYYLLFTVKLVFNGISKVQNIFLLKPGFRLIKVYYDNSDIWEQL
jgi:hypothetical protein